VADSDPPLALLVHALPGRARLRLPALRDDAAGLAALLARVAELPGVTGVQAGTVTGSLLLRHAGPAAALWQAAASRGLFVLGADPAAETAPAGAVRAAVALPAAGAVVWAGLAILQLVRREALPPALTLAWQAVRLAHQAAAQAAGEVPHGKAQARCPASAVVGTSSRPPSNSEAQER
jgi:hypothetical protein